MHPRLVVLSITMALLGSLVPAAQADTILVDDDGTGDFLDIQSAIDVALPGDVILVSGGFYDAFEIDRAITVVADQTIFADNITVTGTVVVRDVPAGATAGLWGFYLQYLRIEDCAGSVILDHSHIASPSTPAGPSDSYSVMLEDAADVRLRQTSITAGSGTGRHALSVVRSRFEAQGTAIDGGHGVDGTVATPDGGPGGHGIVCGDGGFVHIAHGRVRGGHGGDALYSPGPDEWNGGDGADGFVIQNGGALQITGNLYSLFEGGWAGRGSLLNSGPVFNCPLEGGTGTAIRAAVGTSVRLSSQVILKGGFSSCFEDGPTTVIDGTFVVPEPSDLSLHWEGGVFELGIGATYEIEGAPGAQIALLAGVQSLVQSFPKWQGNPLLVNPLLTVTGFTLPASGFIGLPLLIPNGTPIGIPVIVQVASLRPDGSFQLSNSSPLITALPIAHECDPIPCPPTK